MMVQKINSQQILTDAKNSAIERLEHDSIRVLICAGTGCVAGGSLEVAAAIQTATAGDMKTQVSFIEDGCEGIAVKTSGCHGFCAMGPLVRIEPLGLLYCKVTVEDVPEIVEKTIKKGETIERLAYRHPSTDEIYPVEHEIPFYKNQTRIGLMNCGIIDPEDLGEYLAHDGYQA